MVTAQLETLGPFVGEFSLLQIKRKGGSYLEHYMTALALAGRREECHIQDAPFLPMFSEPAVSFGSPTELSTPGSGFSAILSWLLTHVQTQDFI